MASLNRIVIIGKVLSVPESKFSVEGTPISKFFISIMSGFNQPSGKIDVVCWQGIAEACSQLKKDSNVLVEGRIQVRSYQDQAGARKWVTEIIASSLQLLDSDSVAVAKPVVEQTSSNNNAASDDIGDFSDVEALPEDDLPF